VRSIGLPQLIAIFLFVLMIVSARRFRH